MKKLIYNSGVYGLTAVLLKIIGFVVVMWIARTLSVEEYGTFGLFYSIQTGLVAITMAGIIESVIGLLKEKKTVKDKLNLFTASNAIFIIFSIFSIVIVILIIKILNDSEFSINKIFFPTSVGILLGYSSLQSQFFRLQEKHNYYIFYSFVIPFIGFIGSIISFYFYRTILSYFIGCLITIMSILIILKIKNKNIININFDQHNISLIKRRIAPFILVAITGWLSGYGNNYFIKLILENKDVANFTFLLSLLSILQIFSRSINQVWSSRFYILSSTLPKEEVENTNQIVYTIMGIGMGVLGSFIILFLSPFLNYFGGNLVQYQFLEIELYIMTSSYINLIPWWHYHNYYLYYDNGKSLMMITIKSSILGFLIWLILMWLYGSIGIYVGFFIQMFLKSVFILFDARKHWPIKIAWKGILIGNLIPLIVLSLA